MRIITPLFALIAVSGAIAEEPGMTREQASAFAKLALKGVRKEYPNKLDHIMSGAADVKSPKALHPAFYGCFDWHSCVHGHWMLARLLRRFPDLPEAKQIREAFAENLTAKNLQAEADYFKGAEHKSFERPYGWAWLLKLAAELHGWDDADAKQWAANLKPLEEFIANRYVEYLPRPTYPIRTGVHPNTAFGLAFAHDYAKAVGSAKLRELVEERARSYFAKDGGAPAAWEPGGADFFSPTLMEADLMRRVLPATDFQAWLKHFVPEWPKALLEPATVTDRSDPQLVHLDGLNLSRAWCMRHIAAALPADDPARKLLSESAAKHAEAALKHVASGDYAGEHWLASFAVYLLASEGGAMKRVTIVVRGDVQGVGFRFATQDTARALGLRGWVRNRADGAVELVAEGDASAVERLLAWCRKGPRTARVEGVDVKESAATGEFSGFEIRR